MIRRIAYLGSLKSVASYVVDEQCLLDIYFSPDYAVACLEPFHPIECVAAAFRDPKTGVYHTLTHGWISITITLDQARHPVAARLLSR